MAAIQSSDNLLAYPQKRAPQGTLMLHPAVIAGESDPQRAALLAAHQALYRASCWPYGILALPGAPARRVGDTMTVQQILATHGVTVIASEMELRQMGVLVYPARLIVLNEQYCDLNRLDQNIFLRRYFDLVALSLFSAYLIQPGYEQALTLPVAWEADAYSRLWHVCWWMALEMAVPSPNLLAEAPTTAPLPTNDVSDVAAPATAVAPLALPASHARITPRLPETLPSELIDVKREAVIDAVRADQTIPTGERLEAQHPFWQSATLAHVLNNLPWGAYLRETFSPLLTPRRLALSI